MPKTQTASRVRRQRTAREWMRLVLRSRGSPEQVARGMVLGVVVGSTPLLGIHLPLALILTTIFRASRIASFPGVFATNVFTAVPYYTFTYNIGMHFLPGEPENIGPILHTLIRNFRQHDWYALHALVHELGQMSAQAMAAMFIGGFLVALVVGPVAWLVTLRVVRTWRHRRASRLNLKRKLWHEKNASPPAA